MTDTHLLERVELNGRIYNPLPPTYNLVERGVILFPSEATEYENEEEILKDQIRELSKLVKENYPSELVSEIDSIRTNRVVTKRGYARVDEFVDVLECSASYISSNKN